MLQAQLDVHQKEFLRLEASSQTKISELQMALEAEREKVRAYEALERQLDDAIVRTGAAEPGPLEVSAGPSGLPRRVPWLCPF
jgi:hypothetical protein